MPVDPSAMELTSLEIDLSLYARYTGKSRGTGLKADVAVCRQGCGRRAGHNSRDWMILEAYSLEENLFL
jgi:hypothetical protein